jgi:hypothetical protein
MRVRSAFALASVAFTIAACASTGGANGSSTAAVRGDTLLPGDARIDARRLAPGTEQVAWTMERAGQPSRNFGNAVDQLGSVSLDGQAALLRVMTVQRGTATLIDSTWSDARTLAARRHRSVQPGRRLFVDWADRAITGRIEPASGAPIARDATYLVPSFDSSNWELIVRAMDLNVGVRRVYPVYDVDGLLQWYVARVTDTTSVAGRPAWVVKAELGTSGTATLTIEQATRRLASVEVPLGQGTLRMASGSR